MKKVVIAIALLGLIATPAMADIVQNARVDIGRPQFAGALSTGVVGPRAAGEEIFQNLGAAIGTGQAIGQWIHDDLQLDMVTNNPNSSTILDTASFSLWNIDSTASTTLDTATIDLAFHVDDGVNAPGSPTTPLIGGATGITFDFRDALGTPGTGLPFQSFSILTITGLNIDLGANTNIWAGTSVTATTGGAVALGQVGGGTPTVGTSGDIFYKSGFGFAFFGGVPANPPGNLIWELTVPEPGTMALLGLGGMMLLRRRRA